LGLGLVLGLSLRNIKVKAGLGLGLGLVLGFGLKKELRYVPTSQLAALFQPLLVSAGIEVAMSHRI
jgi:hypothetical protein